MKAAGVGMTGAGGFQGCNQMRIKSASGVGRGQDAKAAEASGFRRSLPWSAVKEGERWIGIAT